MPDDTNDFDDLDVVPPGLGNATNPKMKPGD